MAAGLKEITCMSVHSLVGTRLNTRLNTTFATHAVVMQSCIAIYYQVQY